MKKLIQHKSFVVLAVFGALYAGQLYYAKSEASAHAESVAKASFSCQKYVKAGYGEEMMCP